MTSWQSETTTKRERAKSHIRRALEAVEAIPDQVAKRPKVENPPTDGWFKANKQQLIRSGVM